MKIFKLPSIIGYMLLGVALGPSLIHLITDDLAPDLGFISHIALGFVALSIGLELKISHLKRLGKGIILIILYESFGAFLVVFAVIFMLTGDLALSLLFAAIAPASAPAGTVAVIQEYKAKGPLTKALYAVVGFDDGLGIIIFGFASAFAQSILHHEAGDAGLSLMATILYPLKEVVLSVIVGIALAVLICFLIRRLKYATDIFILIFGFVFIGCGICELLGLSEILTIMVVGLVIINTQAESLAVKIQNELGQIMPLIFILFFTLAGANLRVNEIPALGILGICYILGRSAGLIIGSRLGGIAGKVEKKITNWIGLGILSQAGVAIGLSLLVKQEFAGIGKLLPEGITRGDSIGITVITTVTASCIFFEIIGPILTRIALQKAGEING
jgi:Kef-type K+ transport system membrane component KefB